MMQSWQEKAAPLWRILSGAVLVLGAVAIYYWNSKPSHGKITVETRPAGAKILLANQFCIASPCTFDLQPGDYRVEASLDNYMKAATSVTVVNGGAGTKTIRLIPLAPTADEATRMGLQEMPDKPAAHFK